MISGYGMRIFIDSAMAALLAAAFGFRITGGFAHEVFGVCVALFFAFHSVVNARWYARIFSGGYSMRRGVSTFVNAVLAALASVVAASGIASSESLFGLGGATMELRQIHSISAYWLLIFAGIHAGLNGGFFRVRALCVRPKISAALSLGVVLFGAWAFWERSPVCCAGVDPFLFLRLCISFSCHNCFFCIISLFLFLSNLICQRHRI